MIIWNTNKLRSLIITNKLSDKQIFNYYLLLIILTLLAFYPNENYFYETTRFVDFILIIVSTIIGMKVLFKKHKAFEEANFLNHSIPLFVPIGIRTSLIMLIIGFIFTFSIEIANSLLFLEHYYYVLLDLMLVCMTIIGQVVFFKISYKHLSYILKKRASIK